MKYETIAVRPATKRQLDRLRRQGHHRSMDEAINVLLQERRTEALAARIRKDAAGWEKLPKDPALEEFEAAMEGLDETLRQVRAGWRRSLPRRGRRVGRNARP